MTVGVAVVGASDKNMWYGNFRANLRSNGWDGAIWPVNASSAEVGGDQAFVDLDSVPGTVRAVAVVLSKERCPEVVAKAVSLGVEDIVCVASGFSETGEQGLALQQALVAACGPETRLYGPNGVGFADYRNSLCLVGQPMPTNRPNGSVSVISQSGALLNSIMSAVIEDGGGIDWGVSLGNGAQFGLARAIEHIVARGTTRSIAIYAESLGPDPAGIRGALTAARDAGVAVVMLKAGRSEVANKIAYSHTASVAGDDAQTDAFLRAFGVIRVDSLDELARVAVLAPRVKPSGGRGVAVVGASGGQAAVAGELAARDGLRLARLTDDTMRLVRSSTGPGSFVENPFDLTGGAAADDRLFEAIYGDPEVGFVLSPWSITFPDDGPGQAHNRPLVMRAVNAARASGTPTVISSLVNVPWTDWMLQVREENPHITIVRGIEGTIQALAKLFPVDDDAGPDPKAHDEAPGHDGADGVIGEVEGRALLAGLDLPFVSGEVCHEAESAAAAGRRIGFPVVVKVDVPGVAHKAKMGLVTVGCRDEAAVLDAVARARTSLASHGLDPDQISGILVQQMASGREVLLGFHRAAMGAFLTVGAGGVGAGAGSVASTMLLPTPTRDLGPAIAKAAGVPVTSPGVKQAVDAVAALAEAFVTGDLQDYSVLEINPAMISPEACSFVDVLLEPR